LDALFIGGIEMTMRRCLLWIVGLVLIVAAAGSHGAEPKGVASLMRRKLDNAQKILEGLALNDFKMMTRHAEELIQVSKETEWKVIKTPQYELFSNDFRRACETVAKQADEKNLDGAALAYVEVTLTCVKCHKYVREVRMARRD
jgi:hypothetical protein